MFSLMTVVLPQQSGNGASSKSAATTSTTIQGSSRLANTAVVAAAEPREAAVPGIVEKAASSSVGVGQSDSKRKTEICECPCRVDSMTKTSVAPRCPYLKGYMVEQTRHMHSDMNMMQVRQQQQQSQQQPHPVTVREMESLREAACYWKEKYERLYESQKRLQKVNEGLEEKLLKIADKFEGEKSDLTKDVSDLTARLVEARLTIVELEEENEQYRNDCSIAVRLLQCKPSNFVAHKFNSLPADFQTKVKRHINQQNNNGTNNGGGRRCSSSVSTSNSSRASSSASSSSSSLLDQCHPDVRTIKVSVPTLPPAAMVYSVNQPTDHRNHQQGNTSTNGVAFSSSNGSTTASSSSSSEESTPDHVSAAIIAKVLEERSRERQLTALANRQNRNDFYQQKGLVMIHTSTQTLQSQQIIASNLCSRCSSRILAQPSAPSAETMNFARSHHIYNQQPSTISISTETAI